MAVVSFQPAGVQTRKMEWSDDGRNVLSMLTVNCHLKSVTNRRWNYIKTRLAFTMELFNLLVPWDGLPIDNDCLGPFFYDAIKSQN